MRFKLLKDTTDDELMTIADPEILTCHYHQTSDDLRFDDNEIIEVDVFALLLCSAAVSFDKISWVPTSKLKLNYGFDLRLKTEADSTVIPLEVVIGDEIPIFHDVKDMVNFIQCSFESLLSFGHDDDPLPLLRKGPWVLDGKDGHSQHIVCNQRVWIGNGSTTPLLIHKPVRAPV